MLETLLKAIGAIVVTFSALYLISDLFQRLPPKMKEEYGVGAKRFGFWGKVTGFEWTDYRVGYVSGWDVGFELTIYTEGSAEQNEETIDAKPTIILFSSLEAYSRSNIIGWAELGKTSPAIRLTLRPNEVRDILNELRLNPNLAIHVHGWTGEKAHKIEHLSFAP